MKILQSNIELIQHDAEQGVVLAQSNLAWMYYTGNGLKRDRVKAAAWYKRAAERGDVMAQFIMYTFFLKGIGVSKDMTAAVEWLNKAAFAGNVQAQAGLGNHYLRGRGTTKDAVMAYSWLSLAKIYGYRHWYHDMTLSFAKKLLSKSEIHQAQKFISHWQETRMKKLAIA